MSVASIPNVFVGYVLDALEHPPHMYASKLAACCAVLFLDRSDEDLLRSLCYKWALCFINNRKRILSFASCTRQSDGTHICYAEDKRHRQLSSAISEWKVSCTDCEDVSRHFMKVLNSLAFIYFSFNWNKTDFMIHVNREYGYYIKDHVLPLCVDLSPLEGLDEPPGLQSILYSMIGERSPIVPFLSPTAAAVREFVTVAASRSTECGSPLDRPKKSYSSISSPRRSTSIRVQRRMNARAQTHITNITASTYEEFMRGNTTGRLLVFHGVYCEKSNALRKVLDAFIDHGNKDPELVMPKIGVVHTMSEPGLAALYNISWFPTIIYTLPRSKEEEEERQSVGAESEKSLVLTPLVRSSRDSDIDITLYAAGSPIHGFKDEIKFLFGNKISSESPRVEENELEKMSNLPKLPNWDLSVTNLEKLNGTYRVFPPQTAPTLHALREWVRSGGTYVPEGSNETRSMLQSTDALRASLHCAVMLLKRIERTPDTRSIEFGAPPPLQKPPLFIFLGGGMAAGKTTALTALSRSSWWEGRQEDAVVVCADEFKPSNFNPKSAEIHKNSTKVAEQLLIQAINQGRDIVLDSTMMWAPFVMEVVKVVRQAHVAIFKPGMGYNAASGEEEYFEYARPRAVPLSHPYTIVCLGITVEPDIAVPRGLMRQFSSGRGVPVRDQLKSFKLFSHNFALYVTLVDKMILLNNNIFVDLSNGELPPEIARKEIGEKDLVVLDEEAYHLFQRHRQINIDADSVAALYTEVAT